MDSNLKGIGGNSEHPISGEDDQLMSDGAEDDVVIPPTNIEDEEFDTFPQFGPFKNRGSAVNFNPETAIPENSELEVEKKAVLTKLQEDLYRGN